MSHIFRYVQASSTTPATSKPANAQVAKPVTRTRNSDCGCNYDNNYYGDQACLNSRK